MRGLSLRAREAINGIIFALPWFVGFGLLILYPVGSVVYYSLTRYSVLRPPRFVGLENYRFLLFEDELFWTSLWNTVYYTFLAVPIWIVLALLMAILLNQKIKGMSIFRTIFYLPSIVPVVAASMLWLWILNPQYGLLNYLLAFVGISGPGWLASEVWSKPALIIMSTWGLGTYMLIFLAGLQGIPSHLFEAATLDGATHIQKFWRITLPILSPAILFNMVIALINAFQVFTVAYVMAGNQGVGGPANSTLFYLLYLYQTAFAYFRMGRASAMALLLFVIIFIVTLIVFKTSGRWTHYDYEERR